MLNIVKWFKPGASARQKEISAAEHLAEVEARIDRLNDEAGNLYLDGSGNDRRLGEIEVELRDLVARRGWLQRRGRLRAAARRPRPMKRRRKPSVGGRKPRPKSA